jgi:hypothetical protein
VNDKPKTRGAIRWILLLGAILTITVSLFTPRVEWGCSSLLEQRDAPMFLPTDCTLIERAPTGDALGRFKAERRKRCLSHQSWIECASPVGAQEWVRVVEADRRWLPSYLAATYQRAQDYRCIGWRFPKLTGAPGHRRGLRNAEVAIHPANPRRMRRKVRGLEVNPKRRPPRSAPDTQTEVCAT